MRPKPDLRRTPEILRSDRSAARTARYRKAIPAWPHPLLCDACCHSAPITAGAERRKRTFTLETAGEAAPLQPGSRASSGRSLVYGAHGALARHVPFVSRVRIRARSAFLRARDGGG